MVEWRYSNTMPITEMLSRNARMYPNEVSLIEREPAINNRRQITWMDFEKTGQQICQRFN